MDDRPARNLELLQFSDPHLVGDPAGTLRGIASLPALRAALAHARANGPWPVDAILATGDLVQDDPRGYAQFRAVFGALGVPVYCLPGNHDDAAVLSHELNTAPFGTAGADLGAWRIVTLDTSVPGSAAGHLAAGQLALLEASLAGAGARHVLVCLHHHPVPMHSAWLDELALDNPRDLFDILDRHGNVRALLWGHVHQAFDDTRGGMRLLGTPSTCVQFLPRAAQFALDSRPGGYRRLTLGADGSVRTCVFWVDPCAA